MPAYPLAAFGRALNQTLCIRRSLIPVTLLALKTTLVLFSALSFLGYGLGCFFSDYVKGEFRRYQLSAQCKLVGVLQCLAFLGLIAGFTVPWLGQAAAAGLAMMMLVAFGVRIRIRDSVPQMLPALGYLALNAYLCIAGF
jgi:predicted acyltransferase